MASTERREILAFLGFLSLLATATLIVLVARDYGSANQWAAVTALAASVQAVAVLVGLIYAWRQIETSRELDEMRRRREIVDRAADIAFNDVIPRIRELGAATRRMKWHHEEFRRELPEESPDVMEHIRETYDRPKFAEYRAKAQVAADSAGVAAAQLRRQYASLGLEGRVAVYRAELLATPALVLPDTIDDVWPEAIDVDRYHETCKRLENDVMDLVRSAVIRDP